MLQPNDFIQNQVTEMAIPPSDFFIPAHPMIAALVLYGLHTTFSAALFSLNIPIPTFVPFREHARHLSKRNPTRYRLLALFAAVVHVSYPFYMIKLALEYQLLSKQIVLWAMNGLLFGIFGCWPLIFYDFFLEHMTTYCGIPLALC